MGSTSSLEKPCVLESGSSCTNRSRKSTQWTDSTSEQAGLSLVSLLEEVHNRGRGATRAALRAKRRGRRASKRSTCRVQGCEVAQEPQHDAAQAVSQHSHDYTAFSCQRGRGLTWRESNEAFARVACCGVFTRTRRKYPRYKRCACRVDVCSGCVDG